MSTVDSATREHDWVRETLAAWALGALTASERERVERHLETCERCCAEAGALIATASALAEAVPPRVPPGRLRERVLAEVRAEARLLRAAGASADQPELAKRRLRDLFIPAARPLALAGVLLVMLAVGFGLGTVLEGQIGAKRRGQELVGRITDPTVARRAQARATVHERSVRIEVRGLPRPPESGVYEVWVQSPGSPPRPAEPMFVASDGAVEVPVSLKPRDRLMITQEPAGGSVQPTSPPLVVFERSS